MSIKQLMGSFIILFVLQCKKLCDKLETLWQPGCVVLFTWTNFLKEEALEELGVKDQLEWKRKPRNPKYSETQGNPIRPPRHRYNNNARNKKPIRFDPRIVVPKLDIPLHRLLESYNEDRTKTTFMREFHECKICMEVSRFSEHCSHYHRLHCGSLKSFPVEFQ